MRLSLVACLCFMLLADLGMRGAAASESSLRVLVIDNAPPMSFRDEAGGLTGFSVEIARAICAEMRVRCSFEATTHHLLIDAIARGKADFAAAGLLDTPERRGKLLFAKPYYRSFSLWLARPGVNPGHPNARVTVVSGSAQEQYGRKQGWILVPVASNGDLGGPILSGAAEAVLAPMISALSLQKNEAFRQLELSTTVLNSPELGGDAAFGISPRRPDLVEKINAALERIKRNGTYDRINSRFLPFRVS